MRLGRGDDMPRRLAQYQTDIPEKDNRVSVPGPRADSRMYELFKDWYKTTLSKDGKPLTYKEIDKLPQYKRDFIHITGKIENAYVDPFYNNQVSMDQFYKNLAENQLYTGMFEAIGRVTIYAAQYLNNPFAKFIKDPMYHGNAHMAGLFRPIQSHDWWPGKPNGSGKFGVKDILGVTTEDPMARQTYEVTDTGWLFKAQRPEFLSTVSRVNFSREIALRVNARDYARYCQTPEMVGEIGSVLMGQSHAIYMNDMREASKNFFCGVVRSKYEPTTVKEYTDPPQVTDDNPLNGDPMIAEVVIHHEREGVGFDLETIGTIIADGVTRIVHNTTEVDFADFSDKYNPVGMSRIVENCSVVLDKHIRYDTFKKYYAELHHPEFIKPGPNVNFIWINKFPEIASAVYPNIDKPVVDSANKYRHWYELIGMIVDDNAMAIIPYYQPVSVTTFYDPSREEISIFTHYQCDFEFKPFFHRKYIFLHHIASKDGVIPKDIQPNDMSKYDPEKVPYQNKKAIDYV